MVLNYIYTSKIGLKRQKNEDHVRVYELNDGLLSVLCDGLGGNRGGDVASKLAVESFHLNFSQNHTADNMEKIHKSILFANEKIILTGQQNDEFTGMATTIEVLYIQDDDAYWAHIGDSRIYMLKEDSLLQITRDHSFVQKLLDDGYITEKEAEKHPHKNVIMRALGDKHELTIDSNKMNLSKISKWKFLVCSDGVSNLVSKQEIEKILKENILDEIPDIFSELIEKRGAPDNYSFVIISNQ